ncbi:ABC transporter substrate-binding protein [Marinivivus vitaminiproducens]|uniref:ABC transporter substrate-binding protein n=1 Tax=Marinivivus vitaminiproducens TaxID=3035935 RepID=UPI00279AAABC|nr:ABC transporter substrate-binding protein [Geminicoccaceae bacterium SCSIO 64248]
MPSRLTLALSLGLAAAGVACLHAGAAQAQTLRIGLQDDADILDPHKSRTYVGRIVYTALCDKLVDVTPELTFVPQLATEWTTSEDGRTLTFTLRDGVTFHDGTPFDAEAVKANLDRARGLPDSMRKSELASVESVEVIDPRTVALKLKQPDAPLLAQLSDRAGMMLSPAAMESPDFGSSPVCSGPFRFKERVQQDRIVLERYDGYWNKDAYHFDEIVYRPIPDTTVRLANLRSGDLDLIERTAPTDVPGIESDASLKIERVTGLGFQPIEINTGHGERAETPWGQDKRLRQALELSIDREAINQVVFAGLYTVGNQPFPPNSPYYNADLPIKPRDVEKAKALLAEAGQPNPTIELKVTNSTNNQQVGQIIQAMAAEAGITVNLRVSEFAALLQEDEAGDFQASQIGWSGRPDPDGNIHQFVTCEGNLNDGRYCNPQVDDLLNQAREVSEPAERKALYDQVMTILADELPYIYMYFEPRIFTMTTRLEGFEAHPDGMIRLADVTLAE